MMSIISVIFISSMIISIISIMLITCICIYLYIYIYILYMVFANTAVVLPMGVERSEGKSALKTGGSHMGI